MKQVIKKYLVIGMIAVFLLAGCGGQNMTDTTDTAAFPENMYTESNELEDMLSEQMVPLAGAPVHTDAVRLPEASGIIFYGGDPKSNGVTMDASNTNHGYVMIKCDNGSDARKKVIVQGPSGVKYTYNLNKKSVYETFILSDGDGKYTVGVFQNVEGTKYSTLFSKQLDVKLVDQFEPFLSPNQYVDYTADCQTVKLAEQLTAGKTDELQKVQAVYLYVVKNLTYDKQKAQTVQSGYLPVVDQVLAQKKGICFDYAAVMTAMLRSQNIPTKLVTGYTGSAYHAWISTYTEETGWVEGIIFFDGVSWKLMDPTFASSGKSSDAIMKYIGDGKNYTEKYLY